LALLLGGRFWESFGFTLTRQTISGFCLPVDPGINMFSPDFTSGTPGTGAKRCDRVALAIVRVKVFPITTEIRIVNPVDHLSQSPIAQIGYRRFAA
jgi:hypothetical protein